MTLMPDEVRQQVFANSRKGYDELEVDAFLDVVVTALEERDDDILRLRAQLEAKDDETGGAHSALAAASHSATQLLMVAQATADECIAAGKADAAEALRLARQEAQGILEAARSFASQAIDETESRRREVLGSLMYEQQRLQESISEAIVSRDQVRADLENYLTGILSKISERGGHVGSVRALRA
jgi:DivIVA domain-containing protein